jgi:polar amino acid transport system substrate-binding protein
MHTICIWLLMLVAGLGLSAAAQDTTTANAPITAALMEQNLPLTYADSNSPSGQAGLLIDILDELFKQLKLPYAIQTYPWARAQAMVKTGEADFLITVPTEERLQYAQASEQPVYLLAMQIVALKDNPRLEEIKKIKSAQDILALNLTPITNMGNGWHKANIDDLGVHTMYGGKDESSLKMLAARRGDIVIDSPTMLTMEIKRLGLTKEIVATGAPFAPLKFHLLLSKKSKYLYLLPRINQAIAVLKKNGTLDRLAAKYTKLDAAN